VSSCRPIRVAGLERQNRLPSSVRLNFPESRHGEEKSRHCADGNVPFARKVVIGATGWMNSDRFDVNALTGAPATFEQELQMLAPLPIERFHIRYHRESRQLRACIYFGHFENWGKAPSR
jgi:Protein of unknown function (DUF3738)